MASDSLEKHCHLATPDVTILLALVTYVPRHQDLSGLEMNKTETHKLLLLSKSEKIKWQFSSVYLKTDNDTPEFNQNDFLHNIISDNQVVQES